MNPSESFGFAEATASSASGQVDTPFQTNNEINFAPNEDNGESGQTSTPTQSTATTASASEGQPGNLASPQAASGQSLIIWLALAGVLLALVIHHKS